MTSCRQGDDARERPDEGNVGSLHAKRRELLGAELNAPGRSGRDVLEKLFYDREKHVGRFPERHVPGGGYHDVRS